MIENKKFEIKELKPKRFRLLNSEIGNDLVLGAHTWNQACDVFVSLTRR